MNGGFRSVEYKLTEANNYGIRNWKDGDNKIKSVEYKLTKENNLGLRNWKNKNKLNDTTVLPKSNTKEIAKTKASPPSVEKPDQQAATTTKATPIPQKPPQSQPKSIVTNENNAVRTKTSISKTSMSPTDTKISTQSPNAIPATREEEVKQPAKTTDDFIQSYQRTPRGNPEFYTDPQTGERYPNYQRPLHAWQTPYQTRPRFEWQISEPMQSPRFVAQNFIPPGHLSMMDPLYYPMQRPMIMMGVNVSKEPMKVKEKTKEPTVLNNPTPEAENTIPNHFDFLADTGVIRSSSKPSSLVSGRKQSVPEDQALRTRLEPPRTPTKCISAGEELDYDNPALYSSHPKPLQPITGRSMWQRKDPMVPCVFMVPFPPSVPFVIMRAAPAITHYGNRSSILPGHGVIECSTLVRTPGTIHSMNGPLFPVCSRTDTVYATAAQIFGSTVSDYRETACTFRTYRTAIPVVDPMVVRPSSFTQMYGPHVLPMYPQYSYNMPRRIY